MMFTGYFMGSWYNQEYDLDRAANLWNRPLVIFRWRASGWAPHLCWFLNAIKPYLTAMN